MPEDDRDEIEQDLAQDWDECAPWDADRVYAEGDFDFEDDADED